MKKLLLFLILCVFENTGISQHCLSQVLLKEKSDSNKAVKLFRQQLEVQTAEWANNAQNSIEYREDVEIKVVVHVVWNQQSEMISEEQVLSQIEVLNEDYRLQNEDQSLVTFPGFTSVMADMELNFVLADIDPDGNPTNGINYQQTDYEGIASLFSDGKRRICHSDLGGADAWCNDHYLNIWVGEFAGGALGEASFPGEEMQYPEEDGVRISPRAFGRTDNLEEPYHLGRTLTHEVGHYFNLFHLWGDSADDPPNLNCEGDDEVADTPKQAFSYRNTCYSTTHQSCGTPDMHFNFMTYTDDACMVMFTEDQKSRVLATIENARPGLLNPPLCNVSIDEPLFLTKTEIYPLPFDNELIIKFEEEVFPSYELEIFDLLGQKVKEKINLENGINELSFPDLVSGTYFFKISDGPDFKVFKVVKMR